MTGDHDPLLPIEKSLFPYFCRSGIKFPVQALPVCGCHFQNPPGGSCPHHVPNHVNERARPHDRGRQTPVFMDPRYRYGVNTRLQHTGGRRFRQNKNEGGADHRIIPGTLAVEAFTHQWA